MLIWACLVGLVQSLRIPFSEFVDRRAFNDHRTRFVDALSGDGLVAISDIPDFARLVQTIMPQSHSCSLVTNSTTSFADGAVRRTVALDSSDSEIQLRSLCPNFWQVLSPFRKSVESLSKVFAQRLQDSFETEIHEPFLETKEGKLFQSFTELEQNSDVLEHFHSYYRPDSSSSGSASSASASARSAPLPEIWAPTLDWHTDRGLFVAFTPALTLTHPSLEPAGGFFIQTAAGVTVEPDVEPHDLVFMLGDGVNLILNPVLAKASRNVKLLRPTTHALVMPTYRDGIARLWYGRMVLPPLEALHASTGLTFFQLKQEMRSAALGLNKDDEILSLGCSSSHLQVAFPGASRSLLQLESCGSKAIYCWDFCVPFTTDLGPESCGSQGLDINCTNQYDELWDGVEVTGHYSVKCTNSTTMAVPHYHPTSAPAPTEGSSAGALFVSFLPFLLYSFVL